MASPTGRACLGRHPCPAPNRLHPSLAALLLLLPPLLPLPLQALLPLPPPPPLLFHGGLPPQPSATDQPYTIIPEPSTPLQASYYSLLPPISDEVAAALDFKYQARGETLLAVDELIERVVQVRLRGR